MGFFEWAFLIKPTRVFWGLWVGRKPCIKYYISRETIAYKSITYILTVSLAYSGGTVTPGSKISSKSSSFLTESDGFADNSVLANFALKLDTLELLFPDASERIQFSLFNF